jgi:putative glutamine amidotransferase
VSLPAVGISAAIERVRWGAWNEVVTMTTRSYAASVQAAGGLALILPPGEATNDVADAVLDRIDALILTGGSDIDPATYGAQPHPETAGAWPERDRFEVALVERALERELPLLGICRGMQILNVAAGGTLAQHLPELVGHEDHRHTPGSFGDHEVRLEPGSLAARVVGAERELVKSHHHQALDRLGDELVASGWSVPDQVVEAIERPGHRFALGVLWHPEEDERSRVVGALVEAVREGAVRS